MAEKDYNAVLYEKLYSKLAVALGVDSDGGINAGGESLLSIYNPGPYIPAGLDPITSPEDDREISQIFDTAPTFNFTYSPLDLRVSGAYNSILQYKLFPIADLSPEQKKKLAAALASYDELAPKCDAAEDAYWQARFEYDDALASYMNGGPPPTAAVKAKVEAAMTKWISAGKVKQETNVAVIKQLEGRDGWVLWERLDRRYADNQRELRDRLKFPPVALAPKYSSWFQDAGWTKFYFNQRDMDNQSTSAAIGIAGALDGKFGIVTLSRSGDYRADREYIKVAATNLTFTCELMRITLRRNWMDPLVFSSRCWKFDTTAPITKYSTGGSIKDRIVPTGPFVTLPNRAVLARNVEIVGKFEDSVVERMKREINAGASLGIGPFSISGSVSYRDSKRSIKGTIADNKISIKDPQIVAVVSQILPELPDPDPNLRWPK